MKSTVIKMICPSFALSGLDPYYLSKTCISSVCSFQRTKFMFSPANLRERNDDVALTLVYEE